MKDRKREEKREKGGQEREKERKRSKDKEKKKHFKYVNYQKGAFHSIQRKIEKRKER